MVAVRLYVEGGGDAKTLRTACRRGFSEFFRKAGLEGMMPRVIASGSRRQAYDDFCIALGQSDDFCAHLLVDSEASVARDDGPWDHLRKRREDRWKRPQAARDDHCHLMVQCMESWFLADKLTLVDFFGQGFNERALPKDRNIERVPKDDVLTALRNASRRTKTKGRYGKGTHSFEILALIDPNAVRNASPYASRLLETLANPQEAGPRR